MKKSPKRILATIIFLIVITISVSGQTIVSGGIFSNTTWTAANSPYIVVDTTVVFPGVTLTIEPGVTVKFDDNMYIEFRQATLIAIGTITDSITFTSNSPSPTPGIWGHNNSSNGGIWLNSNTLASAFNFCNIKYATSGIGGNASYLPYIKNSTFTYNQEGIHSVGNTPLDSCIFKFNETGIDNIGFSTLNFCIISNNNMGVAGCNVNVMNYCVIDSNYQAFGGATGMTYNSKFYDCSISYNRTGMNSGPGGNLLRNCVINHNIVQGLAFGATFNPDTIFNCEIKYNGLGIGIFNLSAPVVITQCEIEYDTIGILLSSTLPNIYCNKICNNISYGLQMNTSSNFNIDNNYWCTTDSSQIAAAIYDGYDNVAFGLVTFMPIDTTQCYQTTSISEIENQISFTVFPNPFSDKINITTKRNELVEVIFYDITSRKILNHLFSTSTSINTSQLAKGIYFYEVRNKNNVIKKGKIVKE